MTINKPYKKEYNEDGTVKNIFPYNSGISNRQIRRGNERLAEVAGQIVRQRRVRSSKRKQDWN